MLHRGIVNYYSVLEVGEDADEAAIKKSYRGLVLKWHPDKNPAERDKAEEKIRSINTAYSILSNPTKREKYDLQRCAMDKKRRGEAPAKPRVSPKVSAPKEFIIQPLGHTEKFLRYDDNRRTSVVTRQDVDVNFEDFFKSTKMSLWWLPEVNNRCRLRALGSKARGDRRGAAAGLAGGLNFSFRVSATAESEVILAAAEKGKRTENVDFVAKESPEYEGAFRFETACRRGHYLAFMPPSHLRVSPLLNEEEGRVLDFMLVDFAETLKYKDLNEVLFPIAEPKRGEWLPLAQFRDAKEVASYFQKVLQKPVWDAEDFAAYFEGHWVDWEYNAAEQAARLRPEDERLGQVLRSAQSPEDAALAVLSAGEELAKLPLVGVLRAVSLLGTPPPGTADSTHVPRDRRAGVCEVERLKLLRSLPDSVSAAFAALPSQQGPLPTLAQLLDAAERLPSLVCKDPTPDILEHRREALRGVLEIAVATFSPPPPPAAASAGEGEGQSGRGAAAGGDTADAEGGDACNPTPPPPAALPRELAPPPTVGELNRLLRLSGVKVHDAALGKACAPVLAAADRADAIQVLKRAAAIGCEALAEAAAEVALEAVRAAAPDEAAAEAAAIVRAGGPPGLVAMALAAKLPSVGTVALAAAVLALAERGAFAAAAAGAAGDAEDAVHRPTDAACTGDVAGSATSASAAVAAAAAAGDLVAALSKRAPEALSEARETILGLALVASKTPTLRGVLDLVARAASRAATGSWPAVDLVQLLLAVAQGREHMSRDAVADLFASAATALAPKLADLPVAEVVKVVLAASGHGGGPLLEFAAKEAAIRLTDLSLPQALLVTQGLAQGLSPKHEVLRQVFDFWPSKLGSVKKGSSGPGDAGQLSAAQLSKLALATAPLLRAESVVEGPLRQRFVQAIGSRLLAQVAEVPEASRSLLRAELRPEGGLGVFSRRVELLAALHRPAAGAATARRHGSRSRSRGSDAEAPAQGVGRGKKKKRKR